MYALGLSIKHHQRPHNLTKKAQENKLYEQFAWISKIAKKTKNITV